jgi:hypothetical protein
MQHGLASYDGTSRQVTRSNRDSARSADAGSRSCRGHPGTRRGGWDDLLLFRGVVYGCVKGTERPQLVEAAGIEPAS